MADSGKSLLDESINSNTEYLNWPGLKKLLNNIKLKNPEVTLFMIIELVSSTCFTCIMYKEPLPIEKYKPILYDEIRNMIKK